MKNGEIRLAARNSVIHLSPAIPMLLCAQQSLAHFKDFEDNENPWTGIQILSLEANSTSVQHKDHKEKNPESYQVHCIPFDRLVASWEPCWRASVQHGTKTPDRSDLDWDLDCAADRYCQGKSATKALRARELNSNRITGKYWKYFKCHRLCLSNWSCFFATSAIFHNETKSSALVATEIKSNGLWASWVTGSLSRNFGSSWGYPSSCGRLGNTYISILCNTLQYFAMIR